LLFIFLLSELIGHLKMDSFEELKHC